MLTYRGLAYRNKGEPDRAIKDFDQAIRLDPSSVLAFDGRGAAYLATGAYERALSDLNEAIKLDGNCASCFVGRGVVRFCLGNFSLSQADFEEALRLYPTAIDTAVWLYVTESKNSNDFKGNQSELRKNVPHPETGEWPGLITGLYLGLISPDVVLSTAKERYRGDPAVRLCDAYFYVAEHSLLLGNRTKAVEYFQKALDTGAKTTTEYFPAKEELRRLKSSPTP